MEPRIEGITRVEVSWMRHTDIHGQDDPLIADVLRDAGEERARKYQEGEIFLITPRVEVFVTAIGDYGAKDILCRNGLGFMPILDDEPEARHKALADAAIEDALESVRLMGIEVDSAEWCGKAIRYL